MSDLSIIGKAILSVWALSALIVIVCCFWPKRKECGCGFFLMCDKHSREMDKGGGE
jgi:hypothetical protein